MGQIQRLASHQICAITFSENSYLGTEVVGNSESPQASGSETMEAVQ